VRKWVFIKSLGLLVCGLIILTVLAFSPSIAKPGATETATRPKLIVMLVIDQFRYDYLVRFRPQFVQGGFNLLLSGANFTDCRYDYATTATCPGHAALFTGAYANMTGIVGNDWYDAEHHRVEYCVADPDTALVGGSSAKGFSPRNLHASTIGDELRFASEFKSKVIAISLKDRASVIPGGHTANAAYWYDAKTGHFVTSTYYLHELPAWATEFNQKPAGQAYCGQPWRALPETPGAGGKILKEFEPSAGVPCPDPKFFDWLDNTPYMNEAELNFAQHAIEGEHLGQGPATDLLTISLSVNDYIGHAYGPYSPEVADATIRTDRYLAHFFEELDRLVGLKNVWITLSADHGVAPNPYFIKSHNLGQGNAPTATLKDAIEAALTKEFGAGPWVENMGEFNIYLNHESLKKAGANLGRAQFIGAEAAESIPGVRAAFTKSQLATGNLPDSPLARKASNSFYSQRTGDIFIIFDPFAVPVAGEIGTNHGSPWNYDAQVPLIFWGAAFRPGIYGRSTQSIDLAPTLAVALGLTQPSAAQGRPLVDALKMTQDSSTH
jgi:predicted AlkP superfamily pyrophosphatase or phosphodiesterase